MKKSLFVIILLFMHLNFFAKAQERVLSFICEEIRADNAVPQVPQNQATYVQFYKNGKRIELMDGTIWNYQGTTNYGVICYRYGGTNGPVMPGTQYQLLTFNSNYSKMQIGYVFGIMGLYTQMMSVWSFVGEGTEPAIQWINGDY